MKINRFLAHDLRRTLFAIRSRTEYSKLQNSRKSLQGQYSFKPFDDTKTIFIHIPKAAGMSVCMSLYGHLAGGHDPVARYQFVFSKNDFYSYFKFTFVRNPWDRLFSAYTFLKKGGISKQDADWAAANIAKYNNFEQFVTEWVNKENIGGYTHFIPQMELLCLPGTDKLQVNFLGYFENMQSDFDYVTKKFGREITLPHINKTDGRAISYIEVYNKGMIDIVREVYKADIDMFGYSFDNSTLSEQLSNRSKIQLKS
jgi:hypothetical protein